MNRIPSGWTLDASALIAYEGGKEWFRLAIREAIADERPLTVPATALAEVWRDSRSWTLSRLVEACVVEPLSEQLAKRAGELMARVEGATTIDATVAVSAAQRGDIVVTTDASDFLRLAEDLPSIRVWGPTLR